MVILAVLTVVAAPRMVNTLSMRIDMAARNIQSDIRYVQSLAISIQKRTEIHFRADEDDYTVYIESTPGNWIPAINPLTRDDFIVQLNSGAFSGVDLASVYFNGDDRALVFDKWGNPYGYDINSGSSSPLNNPAGIRLATVSDSKDVSVERNTGRAYIQ